MNSEKKKAAKMLIDNANQLPAETLLSLSSMLCIDPKCKCQEKK